MSSMSKKANTRLTMPGQIHKAYKVMLKLMNPKYYDKDRSIPIGILKRAKGIAFVTVVKCGFIWNGTLGSGIVIAKLPDGTWSAPSSLGVGGMGWGALIGANVTDSVIVLNNDLAVKAFSGHGQIKFGGSLSVAAGPLGREGESSGFAGDGGVAACFSYSHSRGLFAGISLQGAIFMTRDSDNARFYGCPVKATDILRGKVVPPDFEDLRRLYDVLNVINNSGTDAFSFRDSKMKSFRDSDGVSFHANKGAAGSSAYNVHKFDDDDDDDDGPVLKNTSSSSGLAWGQMDEDDEAFAKAIAATTIAEKSDDLAPGWVKVTSEGGQPYYWHEETGKTQWEVPVKPAPVRAAAPPPPPPAPKADPDALPPGWVKVLSGDGQPYYWNQDKNLTQWEKPTGQSVPQAVVAAATPTVPPRRSTSSSVQAVAARAAASTVTTNPTAQNLLVAGATNPTLQKAASTSFRNNGTGPAIPTRPSSNTQSRPSIPARPTNTSSNPFDAM